MEECPDGFPRLACFLDSDENFMMYRRFGYLHARILLNKQDEIKEIERELDEMDEDDKVESDESRAGLKSRIDDESRTLPEGRKSRKKLLREAEVLVKEYGMQNDLISLLPPISSIFSQVSELHLLSRSLLSSCIHIPSTNSLTPTPKANSSSKLSPS